MLSTVTLYSINQGSQNEKFRENIQCQTQQREFRQQFVFYDTEMLCNSKNIARNSRNGTLILVFVAFCQGEIASSKSLLAACY